MEQPTDHLTPEELYRQALELYSSAQWDEALAALGRIEAVGAGSHELKALQADIQLKRRLEMVQAPAGTPPPRTGRARLLLAGVVVMALVALLGLSFGGRRAAPPELALAPSLALTGALPTPAPPSLPAEREPETGLLSVRAASPEQLTVGVRNVYLILDASGSMLARAGDRRKIEIAHDALGRLIGTLPDGVNVALRTYGRQRPDDCSDTELVAPLGPLDRTALVEQIVAIRPVNLSRTPLASSLAAIPDDLGAVTGETLVILVSDGEESCEGDPVAAAANLRAAYPMVSVSVVGFDIAPELRERLALIAQAGAGRYVDAADVEQLSAALRQVLTADFQVLDDQGLSLGNGPLGAELQLPAGTYTVTIGAEPRLLSQQIEVRAGMATLVEISRAADSLSADISIDWAP